MPFILPDSRFGMSAVRYNLPPMPEAVPQQEALEAANKLNEHRYLKLTNKQRVFVDSYLANNFDSTKAALDAGFPEDEAPRAGRKLMRRPEIVQAVEYALQYFTEAQKLRFEQCMEELKLIAFTAITDLIDPETVEIRTDVDTDDVRWRAMKKIKRTETKYGTNVEYEMHDRMAALDKLMKILQPNLPGEQKPDGDQSGTTNVTNNNVSVAIIPVPSGAFLPPPPSPYADGAQVIKHQSSATPGLPPGVSVAPRAFVPMESDGG